MAPPIAFQHDSLRDSSQDAAVNGHRLAWLLAIACAACAVPAGDPHAPEVKVGDESDDPAAHLTRMKAVIRHDALISYGPECGTIEVPDRAMIPVEISGGGLPELAILFSRVRCGVGPTRFSGTGGSLVQFWLGSGGPVRLLLEQQMRGFTPANDRLVTMQHGGSCPGGSGPDQCRIIYRWNDRDRRLDVVERRPASELGVDQQMEYDLDRIGY
jgi:hypothetical protein